MKKVARPACGGCRCGCIHTRESCDLNWQLPKQQGRGKLWPAHSSAASNSSDESREHRAQMTGHSVSNASNNLAIVCLAWAGVLQVLMDISRSQRGWDMQQMDLKVPWGVNLYATKVMLTFTLCVYRQNVSIAFPSLQTLILKWNWATYFLV